MGPVLVSAHTPLCTTYTFHPATEEPKDDGVIVLHHGICHTRAHFMPLIRELNARGFHCAMVDQQSENAGFFRNCIGPRSYRNGMADAVQAIKADLQRDVLGYVLHSMGAMIGEEMQQSNPDLRRPTVLMAPIPVHGAWLATWRIMRDQPWAYLRAVLTLEIKSLARTCAQVQQLFFEPSAEDIIVDNARKELKHAPFWMYCRLVLRPLYLWWWITNDGKPKLLLCSQADYLFPDREFAGTKRLYPQLQQATIPGGHDFFIPSAVKTAVEVADFFAIVLSAVEKQPAEKVVDHPGSVPPPHFDEAAKTKKSRKSAGP